MHELAVTQSMLDIALRHGADAHAEHITDLHVVIGQLSSMIDESVQFYWDIISQNTPAEGAKLHFHRIAAEMLCLTCNQRYSMQPEQLLCPVCGSTQVKVVAGEEFYLESIQIESAQEVMT